MAYNIHNIRDFIPMDREMYFLDTNVWIWYLTAEQFGDSILKNDREKSYVEFVRSIVLLNSYTNKKTINALTYQPKIVMTSLLISELINAYLRLGMKAYINDLPEDQGNSYNFKKFRKTLDYQDSHRHIIDEIQQMSSFIEFIDDEFISLKPLELLANLTDKYDFNDFYYSKLLKEKKITVVTDDGDFDFHDIEIVTCNDSLIKLMGK